MVTLTPTTSEQEFNIIPRDRKSLGLLTLVITEEGTATTETLTNVKAFENGDWITISEEFSILAEHRLYEIVITQDGDLWWRGKARCTSQTDKTAKHTLNSVADDGYLLLEDEDDYQIIY